MQTAISRVAVTGASGFVGRVLCRKLLGRGAEVAAIVRQVAAFPPSEPGLTWSAVGEIGPDTDWASSLDAVDVVIHLAARVHMMHDTAVDPLAEFSRVNVAGTERLARCAAASGVRSLVYVSSIKVNGEATCGDAKFSEADLPAPHDPYGISKLEAERALRRVAEETGLEVVIVRPPLVYGPGVKGNFAQMLDIVSRQIPLPFASVDNQRDMVYVENLADALVACAFHPEAAGQTYLVCDGEAISTPGLLRELAAGMGLPFRLFPCPVALLKFAGRLAGKSEQLSRLLGSLRVDGDKIRTDLNWVPPYTLKQGLRATAEWHRTRHP